MFKVSYLSYRAIKTGSIQKKTPMMRKRLVGYSRLARWN